MDAGAPEEGEGEKEGKRRMTPRRHDYPVFRKPLDRIEERASEGGEDAEGDGAGLTSPNSRISDERASRLCRLRHGLDLEREKRGISYPGLLWLIEQWVGQRVRDISELSAAALGKCLRELRGTNPLLKAPEVQAIPRQQSLAEQVARTQAGGLLRRGQKPSIEKDDLVSVGVRAALATERLPPVGSLPLDKKMARNLKTQQQRYIWEEDRNRNYILATRSKARLDSSLEEEAAADTAEPADLADVQAEDSDWHGENRLQGASESDIGNVASAHVPPSARDVYHADRQPGYYKLDDTKKKNKRPFAFPNWTRWGFRSIGRNKQFRYYYFREVGPKITWACPIRTATVEEWQRSLHDNHPVYVWKASFLAKPHLVARALSQVGVSELESKCPRSNAESPEEQKRQREEEWAATLSGWDGVPHHETYRAPPKPRDDGVKKKLPTSEQKTMDFYGREAPVEKEIPPDESDLRREAKRLGFIVKKSRARNPRMDDQCGYQILDDQGAVVRGENFDLTSERVATFLEATAFERELKERRREDAARESGGRARASEDRKAGSRRRLPLLTPFKVAKILNVSAAWVRIHADVLGGSKRGRIWRFKPEDIRRFIEDHQGRNAKHELGWVDLDQADIEVG